MWTNFCDLWIESAVRVISTNGQIHLSESDRHFRFKALPFTWSCCIRVFHANNLPFYERTFNYWVDKSLTHLNVWVLSCIWWLRCFDRHTVNSWYTENQLKRNKLCTAVVCVPSEGTSYMHTKQSDKPFVVLKEGAHCTTKSRTFNMVDICYNSCRHCRYIGVL